MSALVSCDLQNSARDNLESQTNQPGGLNSFPPFSGKLSVDEELKLSCENFKHSIEDFFIDKNTTPLSQLTATHAFPTPHVLAQFASKTYKDYRTGENDTQYETRLCLPDGWKLLTTASNGCKVNGYFGAAYWHPEHQQVVIAHRGTKLTNLGAIFTDLVGMVFENHVPQMRSASTFAYKIVEVLQNINQINGVSFQLFFTGHFLGGWLAQVTTFTTEYLKSEGNVFLRSNNDNDCYHPHTVVFDSPGCKDMLSEMRDTFDVRLDGRSIILEQLDITSYLSAPNFINTCKSHLGTVYRIFIVFTDSAWWEKEFEFYTKARHSIDKIVKIFDTATGQVYKDEQGQMKIQVVIDWPTIANLRGDKEYKSFFEWTKNLNNYHPDIRDVSLQLLHCNPIRYQTKLYDERMKSFSIFSLKEQEFLQCYRWLRQWPEFFKPRELFSVIEDNQAQEEFEKILQNFEIENDTIQCTDTSELKALIPYVKRLLQFFPEIKENINRALSSDGVIKRVYGFETRRYIERISQRPLEFISDASSTRDFIESERKKVLHLQVDTGNEWTGLIKVCQFLQRTGCLNEDQCTVLNLKRLLQVNQIMDLSKFMQSTVTPHLLLIACDDYQLLFEKRKDLIRKLFDQIKQKPYIKIIFTTRSGGSTPAFLKHIRLKISENVLVRGVEDLTISDLTISSQEKQLEKPVQFQGANISLNEILCAETPIANLLRLGALLEENELTIADPLPISNCYNENYYIERTLRHQRAIKEHIFIDENVRDSHVYLAINEEKYTKLCQLHPTSSVHWVEKAKSGKLFWQQSQGSLETLRRYIDTMCSHRYTADYIDQLLEQAQHQRVMMISDTAGMGKSTILTHLSKQIKQKFPAKWVVRIDLNDHTDALKELKEEQIEKENAIEFVSEKLLKLKPGLEMELFKLCCERKQKLRIVIMLDGFEEISSFYKDTVIELLQDLRQTAVEQLWVTTRPHLREELEDKLQQLSYTLEPFSEKEQVEFLTKFWSQRDRVTEPENKRKEIEKDKLENYAKHLIKELAYSNSDKGRQFTGIPLQTRMLAEVFDEQVKTLCQSAGSMPELKVKFELFELYGRFFEKRYGIYQEENLQVNVNNVVAIEQRERDFKDMREDHQLLALKVLFTEEIVALFQNNKKSTFSTDDLTRIGIVQESHDGKLHFINRTFAEYFVADCLVNCLTEGNNISEQVLSFILKDILQKADYYMIRVFVDGLLLRSKPSKYTLKQCGNGIHDLGKYVQNILKVAVSDGIANIIGFLLDSVQAGGNTDTENKMLFEHNEGRLTAWHMSVYSRNIQLSGSLWDWPEENLTVDELVSRVLLATECDGRNAWHLAVETGKLEVLQKIWDWSKENLTTEDIKKRLLLVTDTNGNTAWHLAAKRGKIDVLQKIWEWAKENLTTDDLKKSLLLATDSEGNTAWHWSLKWRKLELLQKIWEWAKENLTTEDIKKSLLFATDSLDHTAWDLMGQWEKVELLQKIWEWAKENLTAEEKKKLLLAQNFCKKPFWYNKIQFGGLEIFQEIWELAKENLTTEEIKNKFLLLTDTDGNAVWHRAALRRNPDVLQKICEWAEKNLTREEIKNELLLAKTGEEYTAWHLAVQWGTREVLQIIWDWTKDYLTTEEIKNVLLLATDIQGNTAWQSSVNDGRLEVLQKVWEWAKENLTTEEIKIKLLIATDSEGRNAWHTAAYFGYLDVLQKICEWAKEDLITEEIKNNVLLATDRDGNTPWGLGLNWGNIDVLQKIWDWAKENLTREEIKTKLLFATDCRKMTAWHKAANRGKLEMLQEIWDWVKENLTTEEIKNELLLATDIEGDTAWHLSVYSGKLEVLQKIWDWAKENITTEEMKIKLLIATGSKRKTAWHMVTYWGNLDILQKLFEWAKENLIREEIKNNVLLASDRDGNTPWDLALNWGKLDVLQKTWEWAKGNLTKEEIKNKLLFATNHEKMTAWHMAVEWGRLDISQEIWDWAKENLTMEEIKNKLFATNHEKMTAWHMAVEWGRLDISQEISD